jgi:hypothetical protein
MWIGKQRRGAKRITSAKLVPQPRHASDSTRCVSWFSCLDEFLPFCESDDVFLIIESTPPFACDFSEFEHPTWFVFREPLPMVLRCLERIVARVDSIGFGILQCIWYTDLPVPHRERSPILLCPCRAYQNHATKSRLGRPGKDDFLAATR